MFFRFSHSTLNSDDLGIEFKDFLKCLFVQEEEGGGCFWDKLFIEAQCTVVCESVSSETVAISM